MIRWGLWDKKDKVWFGTKTGPNTYTDKQLALAAATVLDVQMMWAGRVGVKRFRGEPMRMKDELPTRMSVLEAIKRAEGE